MHTLFGSVSLNLELILIDLARLAGWRDAAILLPPPPQHWDTSVHCGAQLFPWMLGI